MITVLSKTYAPYQAMLEDFTATFIRRTMALLQMHLETMQQHAKLATIWTNGDAATVTLDNAHMLYTRVLPTVMMTQCRNSLLPTPRVSTCRALHLSFQASELTFQSLEI